MKRHSPNNGILLIGPVPPPFGGQSVLVSSIVESNLTTEFRFKVINISHERPGPIKRVLLTAEFIRQIVTSLWVEQGIGLIHIHTSAGIAFYEKALFSIIGKAFRKKIILHIHGGRFKQFWTSSGKLGQFLIRSSLKLNDSLIVLSKEWKNYFETDIKCTIPVNVLENAIKADFLVPTKRQSSEITFLYVGHLKREKGLLDLLDAIRSLGKIVTFQFKVKLMGVGDTAANENMIKSAFVGSGVGNVDFLGLMSGEAKLQHFADSDIFVLPSHSEDMPISILEAMSHGLPVIATNVGAIPGIITDGVNGYLVSPHDVNSLAEKMKLLAENAALRRLISTANINKIQTDYSFATYERKLGNIYDGLLVD